MTFRGVGHHRRRGARGILLLGVLLGCALFAGVPAANAAAGPLTVTPITWNVIGLDSNSPSTGPNTFQVGSRVCNTGTSTATNASATWYWGTSGTTTGAINSVIFNAPAQANAITIGSIAGGACQDVYFTTKVQPPSNNGVNSRATGANYWVQATADGSLSANQTTTFLYIEKLVSQNRNHVQKLSGAGGCNLT
jgi:hypothetical protein